MDPAGAMIDFDCPRCAAPATESYYGPCRSCRQDLRASQQRAAHEMVTERFEPTMHVVPNAVALKE